MTRFNLYADSLDDVCVYYLNRSFQLLYDDYKWSGIVIPLSYNGLLWGAETSFYDANDIECKSIYVLNSCRGKSHLSRALQTYDSHVEFVTVDDCKIFSILQRYVKTRIACQHLNWHEYKLVEQFYGSRCAKRSGVPLMNHIDEGLRILKILGADENTQRGYILHPLLQEDDALANTWDKLQLCTHQAIIFALEYRNIANQFLSPNVHHPGYKNHTKITLSPISEVNQMLIADKIQNRKDFLLYHKEHSRFEYLNAYFKQWLLRLGVHEHEYEKYVNFITLPNFKLENVHLEK